jgi:hypothetical protein
MSLIGRGIVAIWHDLLPEARDEFYEWHGREHMPERLDIPGFRRGRRYVALQGAPEFFNLYEADDAQVVSGPDYLARLNAPTPWTQRVVPSFRNVARGVGSVLFSGGVGQGAVMLTLRFDVAGDAAEAVARRLCEQFLPDVVGAPGVSGAHLCRTDDQSSRIETAEKKARADATAIPRWMLFAEGIAAPSVVRAVQPIWAALAADAAVCDLDLAVYLLQHQRGRSASGA